MGRSVYHINLMTGVPNICRMVKEKKCIYGIDGKRNHFNTFSEAQEFSIKLLEIKFLKILEMKRGNALSAANEAKENNEKIMAMIDKRRRLKPQKLKELKGHKDDDIYNIIKNTDDQDIIIGVVEGEFKSDEWRFIGAALQNKNLSKRFIRDVMIDYPEEYNQETKKWIASNHSLTHEELVYIVTNDKNRDVKSIALLNKKLDKEYVNKIIATKSREELTNKPYSVLLIDWRNKDIETIMKTKALLKNNEDFIKKQHDAYTLYTTYIN